MKTLTRIEIEAGKLYMQLELGLFFDTYHDTMRYMIEEFDYLEEDDEDDYKRAEEILENCKIIIKAQKLLLSIKYQ
jgi:hypothetical protein